MVGTPFAIASTFGTFGAGGTTLSQSNKVADLTGAGGCGGTGPIFEGSPRIVGVTGFTATFVLQLAFAAP